MTGETLSPQQAATLHDGLISRAVEDRLLLPILLYKTARAAGVPERSRMTAAELARALRN
jgi:hypothetical protein